MGPMMFQPPKAIDIIEGNGYTPFFPLRGRRSLNGYFALVYLHLDLLDAHRHSPSSAGRGRQRRLRPGSEFFPDRVRSKGLDEHASEGHGRTRHSLHGPFDSAQLLHELQEVEHPRKTRTGRPGSAVGPGPCARSGALDASSGPEMIICAEVVELADTLS